MSRGWWNSLWIVVVCWSLACSQSADTPTAKSGDGGKVDPAGGAALLPPEPDDDSGTARVTDKAGKARLVGGEEANPFKDVAAKEGSPVEQGPPRKSLAGKWILVLTRPTDNGFIDFHTGIVTVSADDTGAMEAEWGTPSGVLPPATLKTAEVAAQQIHLEFDVSGTLLDFRGKLKNGVVSGNAVFGNCLPARLVPTKEESLDGFNANPEPVDARTLGQVFSIKDPVAAGKGLKKFVADKPDSPLGMMAWEAMVMIKAMTGGTTEDLESLISDYESAMAVWGPRLQQAAKGNVAMVLAHTKFEPEYSLKYISAADKAITDATLKELKDQLKNARESILVAQALVSVESNDPDRAKKAFDTLTKLRQKSPFEPTALYGLARYLEKSRQIDSALELYAEIATLPMLEVFLQQSWKQKPDDPKRELPSEALAKLWEKKTGSSDGLDEFKDSIYRKYLVSFADEAATDPPAGNRIVLCELFTGAFCPPCVGADVATAGLEFTYPKSQVIVLRYHQHIPAPDPLTNADGEERFSSYYRLQSTPSILLNGAAVTNVGGFLHSAPGIPPASDIYKGLKTLVDKQLEKKAEVKVRLAAKVTDGTLQIAADVQGLDQLKEDELNDLRLRVVIAEDEVHFLTRNSNGIRLHEMIVRRMIGGPDGTEVKDGKLAISEKIPLAELKSSLADYLAKYEEGEMMEFSAKPLDLKRLHIVAFVQNDDSREVLQTAAKSVAADGSATSNAITPATGNAPVKSTAKKPKPAE